MRNNRVSRRSSLPYSITPSSRHFKAVHLVSTNDAGSLTAVEAPARQPDGTWNIELTVAVFRPWRGSQASIASDPAFNAAPQFAPPRRRLHEEFRPAIAGCWKGEPLPPRLARPNHSKDHGIVDVFSRKRPSYLARMTARCNGKMPGCSGGMEERGRGPMKRESRGSLSGSGLPMLIGAGLSLFKRLMRGSLGSPPQRTPLWTECNRRARSTHFPRLRLHISPDCGFTEEGFYCPCCLKGGYAMRSRERQERLPAAEVLSKIWMCFGIAFWLGVGAFLIWRLIA